MKARALWSDARVAWVCALVTVMAPAVSVRPAEAGNFKVGFWNVRAGMGSPSVGDGALCRAESRHVDQ